MVGQVDSQLQNAYFPVVLQAGQPQVALGQPMIKQGTTAKNAKIKPFLLLEATVKHRKLIDVVEHMAVTFGSSDPTGAEVVLKACYLWQGPC